MKAAEQNAPETIEAETSAADTRPPQWTTYRTRFLVKAKQLSATLAFTDSLGRRHAGRKGDYLVESSDGVLSIAPRQIFEDIYVSMLPTETEPEQDRPGLASNEPARIRRKLPQPCRVSTSSGQWSVVKGSLVRDLLARKFSGQDRGVVGKE